MRRNQELKAGIVLAVPVAVALTAGGALGEGTGLAVAGAVAAGLTGLVWLYGGRVALAAMHARPVSEIEYPELYRAVRDVSKAARLPMPRVYVSPAMQPNCFTAGHGRRDTAICCTEGLLHTLDGRELRGVLGHELAHVRAGDVVVSTVAAGLAGIVTLAVCTMWFPSRGVRAAERTAGGVLTTTLLALLGPLAALLIHLSIRRAREYRADVVGARLSGDPLALARALRKIEAGAVAMPLLFTAPLAATGHLMIVNPFRDDLFTRMFGTHPPTAERVYRLEALAGYPR